MGPLGGDATGSVRYRAGAVPLDWIGPMPGEWWGRLGIGYRHTISGVFQSIVFMDRLDDLKIVTLPHWAVVLPLAIWPVIFFRRVAKLRRRKRMGLCLSCGYDLRGIDSGRCPECGASVDGLTPSPLVGEGTGR
jgi:hypothetical protein